MNRRRALTLATFFGGGLLLLAIESLTASPDRPHLVIRVPDDATPGDLERLIDEAVLVEVGLALGWRTDPLVRDRVHRIAANVQTALAPLDLAESLDLPRRDPLIRARLIERARRSLPEPSAPSASALAAFYDSHRDAFLRPPTLRFEHRFTRDPSRAENLTLDDRGEPELLLGPTPTRTVPELTRTLGADAATSIAKAPVDQWRLVQSPLGHHAIRLLERHDAHHPPLDRIRPEVLLAWREAHRPALHHESLRRLRDGFELDVRSLPSTPTEAAR